MDDLGIAAARFNAQMGIAFSQLSMGHWTPGMYFERTNKYKDEMHEAFQRAFVEAARPDWRRKLSRWIFG
jgi:hypothetical protein